MKKIRRYIVYSLYYLPLVMVLFLGSCVVPSHKPVYIKEGKEYGEVQGTFRHRWWNYYERGISFAEGEFFHEAITDITEAIQKRPNDQRMARTYGMHFINYFPHRELGIIYFELGRLKDALTEIEYSLSLVPSSKAYFYRDCVWKALIEQEGKEVSPPKLTISLKNKELWTKEDPVVISGVAEDKNYITGITLRDTPIFLESSQKNVSFKQSLDLPQGSHSIAIIATNIMGKSTKKTLTIHVDREGPIIIIDSLKFIQLSTGKELTISGYIYDKTGVIDLSINGQPIVIQHDVEASFTEKIIVEADRLELTAHDKLGNQTSDSIPLYFGVNTMPLSLAWNNVDESEQYMAGIFGFGDNSPPTINIKDWTVTQTVFLKKVYIEGEVSDESTIESLTINQIPILHRKGQHIIFNHFVELNVGENIFTLLAKDESGNTITKRLTFIRQVPKALQFQERLALSVFPFEKSGIISHEAIAFQEKFIDDLVNQNRFRIIERSKLDIILQEQRLSLTKLIDERTALNIGKLAAAQSIIVGAIIETRKGTEIIARMIDTETSDIPVAVDVYTELKGIHAINSLSEGMAIKFHHEFPLVNGLVIECKDKEIFTDLGQDMIKLLRRLIVYHEEPVRHPVTGALLGADNTIIGYARVIQVMPNMSKAALSNLKGIPIQHFDQVITQ